MKIYLDWTIYKYYKYNTDWGLIHIRKQVCSIWSLNQSTVSLMMDDVLMLSVPFYSHCALHKLGQTTPPHHHHQLDYSPPTHTHTFTFSLRHVALLVKILLIGLLCVCHLDGSYSDASTDALHHHIWLTSPARHISPKWRTVIFTAGPVCALRSPLFYMRKTNFDVCEINGQDDSYICWRFSTVGVLSEPGVACVGVYVGCMSETSYMHI